MLVTSYKEEMQQKPGLLDKTEQSHASSSFQTPDFEEISNQGPNLLLFESPRETMLDNIKQYFDSASNVGRNTLGPLCETDQNCNHAQERITYVQEAGKYECAFCGQTYGSSGELLAHLRAVHGKELYTLFFPHFCLLETSRRSLK